MQRNRGKKKKVGFKSGPHSDTAEPAVSPGAYASNDMPDELLARDFGVAQFRDVCIQNGDDPDVHADTLRSQQLLTELRGSMKM